MRITIVSVSIVAASLAAAGCAPLDEDHVGATTQAYNADWRWECTRTWRMIQWEYMGRDASGTVTSWFPHDSTEAERARYMSGQVEYNCRTAAYYQSIPWFFYRCSYGALSCTRRYFGPQSGGACFVAGTRVATLDGSVAIEEVAVGSRVLTFDRDRNEIVAGVVGHVFRFEDRVVGELTLADGTRIVTTPDHPFYSASRKAWVYAEDLEAGELVAKREGLRTRPVRVVGFRRFPERATVYNFMVEMHHTYFAEDVLVHNRNTEGDDVRDEPAPDQLPEDGGEPDASSEPEPDASPALESAPDDGG